MTTGRYIEDNKPIGANRLCGVFRSFVTTFHYDRAAAAAVLSIFCINQARQPGDMLEFSLLLSLFVVFNQGDLYFRTFKGFA